MWRYCFLTIVSVLSLLLYFLSAFRSNLIENTSIQLNIISAEKNFVNVRNLSEKLDNKHELVQREQLNENEQEAGHSPVENKRLQDEIKTTKKKIKHHVPKFMLDLYEQSVKSEKKDRGSYPDIVRSVVPKASDTFEEEVLTQNFQGNHILTFDLPIANEDEIFLSAELKLLSIVQVGAADLGGMERLLKISVFDNETKQMYFVDKLQVYHTNNTWISFNVTAPVVDLLRNNLTENLTLKIIISIHTFVPYKENNSNHFKLSLLPVEEDYEHDYPILLLSYASISFSSSSPTSSIESSTNNGLLKGAPSKRHLSKDPSARYAPSKESFSRGSSSVRSLSREPSFKYENYPNLNRRNINRTKRNIEEDYEEETNRIWDDEAAKRAHTRKIKRLRNTCKIKQLYVDFAEIEYDSWIVQPTGYEAYQCQGKCFYPVAEHLSPTKHAILQSLLHSVSPSRAVRSCCVPTNLESISILYIDRGVLTYRFAYKDMVVTECGCR